MATMQTSLDGSVNVDATGRVMDDVPCVNCGCNLRGLLSEGVCPECGRAVADSLKSRDLQHADAGWLKRLVTGVTMVAVHLLAFAPCLGLYIALHTPRRSIHPIVPFVTAIVVLLGAYGCWNIAAMEPGRDDDRRSKVRKTVRGVGVTMGLLAVLWGATLGIGYFGGWSTTSSIPLLILATLLPVGALSIGARLRSLALRVEVDRLTLQIRICLALVVGVWATLLVLGTLMAVVSHFMRVRRGGLSDLEGYLAVSMMFVCIVGLAGYAVTVGTLFQVAAMLRRMRGKSLRHTIDVKGDPVGRA